MRLYDDVLKWLSALLPPAPAFCAAFDPKNAAKDGEKDQILFGSDTAFELGGGGKASVCGVLFADEPQTDEVLLYGPDLCEIRADSPFAHFTVARLTGETEDAASYEDLQTVGFTVFQVYPEGYHIRVSPSTGRERVRVAKAALRQTPPLSFLNVGTSLIKAFKAHPGVAAVRTVYVTDPKVDYTVLADLAARARDITAAVKHTLETGDLDCAACKMKPICDTVEGLRDLHFRKEQKK